MANISRRGFLQGTLTGVVGAVATVALATPEEAQALVRQPVGLVTAPPLVFHS